MVTATLAIILARFDRLRGLNVDQLRMVADLMIGVLLSAAAELLDVGTDDDVDGDTERRVLRGATDRLRLIAAGAAHRA
jgi:hypothetical protein